MSFASSYGLPYSRLLSAPHIILWAGWESTTSRLQQEGWQFAAHQNYEDDSVQLVFKHQEYRMRGISERIQIRFLEHSSMSGHRSPPQLVFHCHVAGDFMMVQHNAPRLRDFKAIDAIPQMVTTTQEQMSTLEEALSIFVPPLVRTKEIIVEPKDVQEAMDALLRLQSKELSEVRAREKSRERRENLHAPRDVFHAQIISLAA